MFVPSKVITIPDYGANIAFFKESLSLKLRSYILGMLLQQATAGTL